MADQTKKIYEELVKLKGDRWYAGYETSESDEDEQLINIKTKEKDELLLDDDGNEMKVELDADEIYQQQFEEATISRPYIIPWKSSIRVFWDSVIIVFAIINSFFLPLSIAHKEVTMQVPSLVQLD